MGLQAPISSKTTNNTILETKDYDLFKWLPHNRPVIKSHVAQLAQSMLEKPHLRPARPILVNEEMQMIDGQHRYEGNRVNSQSVYYMIVPGLTIDDARLLNALQRTWSLLDYAYSYASSYSPAYVQFIKAYETHQLPPSVVMETMMPNSHQRQYKFRTGQLQTMDHKILQQKLGYIEDVVAAFPKTATPYVVSSAFQVLLRNEAYNQDRMLKKLKDTRPEAQADRIAYVRELERIYNADVMFNGPNYLRFF